MVTKTIETFVEIDLDSFATQDLIDEVESRGGYLTDDIYELYRDYIDNKDFDRKLKKFFEKRLKIIVT